MEEALSFIETVSDYFPGKVYVQAVRMKDNEEDLEMLYKNWKNRKQELIIQKYDHFCHKLPDKRVTDLSPVKRMPCWHIKRDMNILLNGDVPLCREDLDKKFLLGNIFKQDLKEIWMSGFKIYQSHLEDNYNELCAGCDEYYTYNF
jgi:spiro-SPASM protein